MLLWVLLLMAAVSAWRPLPDPCPVPAADSVTTDIRYDSEHIRYPMFAAMRHVLTLGQQPACFGQLQAMQQTIPGYGWTAAVAAVLQQQALGLFAGWVRVIRWLLLALAALLLLPDLKTTLLQHRLQRKSGEKTMTQGVKRILAAGFCLLLTACQTPPQPMPAVLAGRAELIVLRQTTHSDAAWIDEEEGTYIGAAQTVSPFGIVLAYDVPGQQRQLLYTVYFDTASTQVSEREKHYLAKLLPYWQASGVTLSGYADPRGSIAYNDRLARRRADSVAAWLSSLGVSVNRRCIFGEKRLPDGNLCAWRTSS